jgi:Mg2+ and Co2+ transporter CorA
VPHVESQFREDIILPLLAFIVTETLHETTGEHHSDEYCQRIMQLFEVYTSLSRCSHSNQAILNSLLPSLYCLRTDVAHYRTDYLPMLDTMIDMLENQLEHNTFAIDTNQDDLRQRMMKSFNHIRGSTEKFTYRWMKRK